MWDVRGPSHCRAPLAPRAGQGERGVCVERERERTRERKSERKRERKKGMPGIESAEYPALKIGGSTKREI